MASSLDHKDEEGSVNNLKQHLEHPEHNSHSISRQKHSSSSSLSDSSIESVVLENNGNGIADTFESKHVPALSYSSDHDYPSPAWTFQSASTPLQPPNRMIAAQLAGSYDSNRIPMSIFSSRPTDNSAWSYQSNESLFSIQVGNNSFSREHFLRAGKTFVESAPNKNCADNDTIEGHLQDSVSTRISFENTVDSPSPLVMHCVSVKSLAESTSIALHDAPKDDSKETMPPSEQAQSIASLSHRSDDSRISNRFFQFPLLSMSNKFGRKSKLNIKPEKQEEEEDKACAAAEKAPNQANVPYAEAESAPNHGPRIRKRWYLPSCGGCSSCSCSKSIAE